MRLTPREKKLIWVGGVVAALALGYQFWLAPFLERRAGLASQVGRLRGEAQRISALMVRYRDLQQRQKAFDRLALPERSEDSLLRALEATLSESGLKDRLVSANPGRVALNDRYAESSLQVKLAGLRWREVIQFLHRIEGDKMKVWVKKFRLITNEGTKRLDGEFSLAAFVKRDGEGIDIGDW
ncbi:MAG: type II secretion system protein GspM [Nitrospinota bacterium]